MVAKHDIAPDQKLQYSPELTSVCVYVYVYVQGMHPNSGMSGVRVDAPFLESEKP